jgi:hypothetical protein
LLLRRTWEWDGRLSWYFLDVCARSTAQFSTLLTDSALLTFYVQTWDEYHTKTLTLGIISGPVEGIIILILVYAFTAVKGGASFWQQSMFRAVGIPEMAAIPDSVYEMSFTDWYMIQGGIVLVLNTIQSYGPHSLSWQRLTFE